MILMVDNQLLLVNSQSKVFDKNLFDGLNWVKNKFNVSKNNFESNKTKFINELKDVSNHYGFKYISSKIVYEGNIPEHVFEISSHNHLNLDDEEYYYDEIITHMEHFCKINKMFDLFKDSYIILK